MVNGSCSPGFVFLRPSASFVGNVTDKKTAENIDDYGISHMYSSAHYKYCGNETRRWLMVQEMACFCTVTGAATSCAEVVNRLCCRYSENKNGFRHISDIRHVGRRCRYIGRAQEKTGQLSSFLFANPCEIDCFPYVHGKTLEKTAPRYTDSDSD